MWKLPVYISFYISDDCWVWTHFSDKFKYKRYISGQFCPDGWWHNWNCKKEVEKYSSLDFSSTLDAKDDDGNLQEQSAGKS